MAEPEQQGALAQLAGADNSMVKTAADGNPLVSEMLSNMFAQGKQRQNYLEQQQGAYNNEMQKYAEMVANSQRPEEQDASMWGSMAEAAASVAPTWGNLGAMIGLVGAAYGKNQDARRQQDIRNQEALTKLRQSELRSLEARDQNAAMIRALSGGNKGMSPTIKVVDGKMIKYDPVSGTTEVLSGSQDQVRKSLFTTFYNAAVKNEIPNPEDYAEQQTQRTLSGFNTTVTGKDNAIPGTQSTQPVSVSENVSSMLSKQDQALAERLLARINANPAAAERDTATLEKILSRYNQPQAPAQQVQSLSYIDKPRRKMEEATGAVAGKALGEEQSDLNTAAASSSQMIGQLDLLKKLYLTPNMPEGQLGAELQNVRSGLKSIGIDVGEEVGAADLASAIAGKMALLTRTADGKNLMPGAMSDFEQKILRGLVPGLEGTAEGRAALIDVMKAMAQSRIRFAEEANKMANANRGILPSEWNARKQRIMKEEMARMALINKEIAERFQGAKK